MVNDSASGWWSSLQYHPCHNCECAQCLHGWPHLEPFLPALWETQHQIPSFPLHFGNTSNDTLDLLLELLHFWRISSPYPKSDQVPLFFQSLLPDPHLCIHYSFILQISTAFTTSLSPPIPLLLSSIPIPRALQAFIPFPTRSDPLRITSSAPWTLSCQHPRFPCFSPGE